MYAAVNCANGAASPPVETREASDGRLPLQGKSNTLRGLLHFLSRADVGAITLKGIYFE